jgi:hypothetical protein
LKRHLALEMRHAGPPCWERGSFLKRRLPLSSRHHEFGVWQGMNRIDVEVIRILRGARGRYGGATGIFERSNGRKTRTCKRNHSDASIDESSNVIWKITREYVNVLQEVMRARYNE